MDDFKVIKKIKQFNTKNILAKIYNDEQSKVNEMSVCTACYLQ